MHPLLARADGFKGLLKVRSHELPYRFDTIFEDESRSDRRRSKKKFKLLRRIDDKLREVLDEGEEVRFLTRGTIFTFWESYFLGWLLYYFNKRAVVLTDRRILLLQIQWRSTPGVLASQIRYRGIEKVKAGFLGGTRVKLGDGKTVRFSGMPRSDGKFLERLVNGLTRAGFGDGAETVGKDELCPHCYAAVSLGDPDCWSCGGTFKSPRTAGLRSLLLPGLGDFYMGHRKLATTELLFTLLIWVLVFLPDPENPVSLAGALVVGAFLFVFIHVPDAVGTWYLARRGVFPGERGSAAARRARASGPGRSARARHAEIPGLSRP